jgi:hypothetical protein
MHNPAVKHQDQLYQVRGVCFQNAPPHPLGNLSLESILLIIPRDIPGV